VLAACALLCGCSSGGAPAGPSTAAPSTATERPPVPRSATQSPQPHLLTVPCTQSLRAVLGRVDRGTRVTSHAEVTTGLTTCVYRAPRSTCPAVKVTINTEASAFKDFNRWAVETAQTSSGTPGGRLAPRQVGGIGLLADWVPGTQTFEAATVRRWVAIYLTCRPASPADLRLAEALARSALIAS
jgi:hypothetical protein